jgi:putative ABC transport system permease protein
MRTTLADLRYAFRLLLREPVFSLVALATLALGIGANSAIFAIVNAVLLRPLPYSDPDRLVLIQERIAKMEFQHESQAFQAVAGFVWSSADLTGDGQPERLRSLRASSELFPILGVAPAIGRTFTPDEDRPASGVAVISYRLWQRRFGGDRGIVGHTIRLDRQPVTVVGVMPTDFDFPLPGMSWGGTVDLWVPMGFTPAELAAIGDNFNYGVIARLKPGVTLARAEADVKSVAQRIFEKYPAAARAEFTLDALVAPVVERVVSGSRNLLWLLLGAVGFVLLIACVNVANLLLSRSARRERELAIRASLGAGRARLLRQLLTESLLLAAGGGALGLLLAGWLMEILVRVIPASVPRASAVSLDWHVAGFTLAISVLAGLLFGMLPAMTAARADEGARLRSAVRGATASAGRAHLRGVLIVSEVALSLVLLVGAGLLVRSFLALRAVDPGFDTEHVMTASVELPSTTYKDAATIRGFYTRLLDELRAIPGATAAGAGTMPLLSTTWTHTFGIKDAPDQESAAMPLCSHSLVLGNYFQALGIKLRSGRLFDDTRDRAGAEPVLVINETLARKFFAGQDPIGKQLRWGGKLSTGPWLTIVGVVADAKNNGLADQPFPQTYEPYLQTNDDALTAAGAAMNLTLRAAVQPEALTSAVRGAIARLDRELPVNDLKTARAVVEASLTPVSFQTALVGAFAALALLLAAIGIYGVVSYTVAQRTQEIGVRMALGATRGNVLKLVIGQGMKFVLAGAALGLAAAWALTRVMAGFLYGVSTTDSVTFIAAPVVLCLVAMAANLAPARRASGVDPVVALRYE